MQLQNILDISIPHEYVDICYYLRHMTLKVMTSCGSFPYFTIPPQLYKLSEAAG